MRPPAGGPVPTGPRLPPPPRTSARLPRLTERGRAPLPTAVRVATEAGADSPVPDCQVPTTPGCGQHDGGGAVQGHLARGHGRGRLQGAGRTDLLLSCAVSCPQINGIIQFPGLLTFSLGINCDRPDKHREITLKHMYTKLMYSRRLPSLKNTYDLPGKKQGSTQSRPPHAGLCRLRAGLGTV